MQALRSVDKILCRYLGDLHTEAQHLNSGQKLRTDAPLDHSGKGENFAPTDLLATSLASCFLTVMGIAAKEKGWELNEVRVDVDKKMTTLGPRKIESLLLQIEMPVGLKADQLKVLKKATRECPVLRSLNNSIKIKVKWNQAKKKKKTSLNFVPTHIFRETPQVTFFDASVKGSNGSDVVIHHGSAISPPSDDDFEQFYVHHHQVDYNLVLEGSRTFTLLNPEWNEPHHVIFLNQKMGALQVPKGTYHRSVSGTEGSMVLNQSVRDIHFDPSKEFIPVSLRAREDLRRAKGADPIFWFWDNGRIRRLNLANVDSAPKRSKINCQDSLDNCLGGFSNYIQA